MNLFRFQSQSVTVKWLFFRRQSVVAIQHTRSYAPASFFSHGRLLSPETQLAVPVILTMTILPDGMLLLLVCFKFLRILNLFLSFLASLKSCVRSAFGTFEQVVRRLGRFSP